MAKRYRILYLIIALCMIFSSTSVSLAMASDIEGHWAQTEIIHLIEKGAMPLYPDGTFKPQKSITRAEFIKAVNNIYEFTDAVEIQFKDVKKEDSFYEDIKVAAAAGYINGYEDGTMRPNGFITRQEASKILSIASELDGIFYEDVLNFKDKDKIGDWAIDYVNTMVYYGYLKGYPDGTFGPKKYITRAETAKILNFIEKDLAKREEEPEEPEIPIEPEKPVETPEEPIIPVEPEKPKLPTKEEQFIQLIDELPEDWQITKIVAEEKVNVEKARKIYDSLSEDEKRNISREKVEKLIRVENKIESLKTPIMSRTKTSILQAQAWAIKKGAHKRFVDVAEYYWEYGELTGINPEILYVQAAKETSFGRYTGQVKPEMNNWAGIKAANATGDTTYDHEVFPTPEDGVRAHFNHMGIYCGVDPIGEPHPRWYSTRTAAWAGTVKYIEDTSGKWAPNPDYGISIVRDYLNPLYETPIPREEDMRVALEFSNFVEELEEYDADRRIFFAQREYENLSSEQKALIPNNIKAILNEIGIY